METAFAEFVLRFNQFGTVSVADTVLILQQIGWHDVPENIVRQVADDDAVDYRAFSYLLSLRIQVLQELVDDDDDDADSPASGFDVETEGADTDVE